jgi:uncharacterized protein YndB with AHSA1/START domain
VSELAKPFAMSLPAVMKHLDVLSDAGLMTREKTGKGRFLPPDRTTDGAGDGMAQSLRALLVRKSRPPCRFCGGRHMVSRSNAAADASLASRPSLTLTRRLNAPLEKVYAAWADPQKLTQWFGPSKIRPGTLKAEMDVRVGGRYRISFEQESGEYSEVGGVYREVVPNARLVFSWAWHSTPERESLVTVQLRPDGAGTLLTFHHEQFADQTARDNHERGWNELLGKLENYLA